MGTFKGFKCDKCKKEFRYGQKDHQPNAIKISIDLGLTSPSNSPHTSSHVVWCRPCVMATGFYRPLTESDKKVAPEQEPTFEEKFSMLIEEMGFVREG